MNNFSIQAVLQAAIFLADSIFTGLKLCIPAICLLTILVAHFRNKIARHLTETVNGLLAAGGLVFFVALAASVYNMWHSEDEFGKSAFINMVAGPHWFQFVLPALCYAVLPNLFWISGFRKSISASFLLVMCWGISYFIIVYFSYPPKNIFSFPFEHVDFHVSNLNYKLLTFVILATIAYFIQLKKKS